MIYSMFIYFKHTVNLLYRDQVMEARIHFGSKTFVGKQEQFPEFTGTLMAIAYQFQRQPPDILLQGILAISPALL